jgi:hypothetical protein
MAAVESGSDSAQIRESEEVVAPPVFGGGRFIAPPKSNLPWQVENETVMMLIAAVHALEANP